MMPYFFLHRKFGSVALWVNLELTGFLMVLGCYQDIVDADIQFDDLHPSDEIMLGQKLRN